MAEALVSQPVQEICGLQDREVPARDETALGHDDLVTTARPEEEVVHERLILLVAPRGVEMQHDGSRARVQMAGEHRADLSRRLAQVPVEDREVWKTLRVLLHRGEN